MQAIIVGAGVTGLALAHKFCEAGLKTLVLERNSEVGGLCRTFRYGSFFFDIGPHRLFSAASDIFSFFSETLGDEAASLPRRSAVFMNGKFLDWPLNIGAMFRLPPAALLSCAADALRRDRKNAGDAATLREYVEGHYGPTIYNMFWREYTRKFIGLPCEEIAAEWAAVSVGRSFVDRKNAPVGLLALLRNTLLPRRRPLSFAYPRRGMGVFPSMLAERVRRAGGEVVTNAEISGITVKGNRIASVRAAGTEYAAERLVWTGALPELCRLLGATAPDVAYLSTVLFNVELDAPFDSPLQWIYFPDSDVVFSRVSFPAAFSSAASPPGKTGICVEITCLKDSDVWRQPESLRERVEGDLVKTGLARSRSAITAVHIERVPDTYPVYRLGYRSEIEKAFGALRAVENLHLVGRQAMFVHDNIDEAIREAWTLAAQLAGADAGLPGGCAA